MRHHGTATALNPTVAPTSLNTKAKAARNPAAVPAPLPALPIVLKIKVSSAAPVTVPIVRVKIDRLPATPRSARREERITISMYAT